MTPPALRLQLLSDLHLESESFAPRPEPGADALILAGDIDATWAGYERFAGWPVPVFAVAGNHEFDGRDWHAAWAGLKALGERLGIRWLEQDAAQLVTASGCRVRLLGCTRWSDFDAFGPAGRPKAERAARFFLERMQATLGGAPLDAAALRALGLANRRWLEQALAEPSDADVTVVVTHFAPSLRCADPRYGLQPGTASFCNADDDLMGRADLWLHGHLHSRHDLWLDAPKAAAGAAPGFTRVVNNARGLARRGEADGHDGWPSVVQWPLPRPETAPASSVDAGLDPAPLEAAQTRAPSLVEDCAPRRGHGAPSDDRPRHASQDLDPGERP